MKETPPGDIFPHTQISQPSGILSTIFSNQREASSRPTDDLPYPTELRGLWAKSLVDMGLVPGEGPRGPCQRIGFWWK